jgi:hypothetical protein
VPALPLTPLLVRRRALNFPNNGSEKLKREVYELGEIIHADGLALKSKTMSSVDRDLLQRQMMTRMAHRKLLQAKLDRLES